MWVKYLIEIAYIQHADLQSSGWTKTSSVPLTGGPKWIESDLFTIEAKADGLPSARMMLGPMLQVLLEDHFKIKLRREVKEIPVYEMRVVPSGFKLQSLPDGSCTPQDKAPTPGSPEWKGVGRNRICGNARGGRNGPLISLNLTANSLADLAAHLELDRLVIDKTNIPGLFDISLTFGRDSTTDRMFGGPPQAGDSLADPTGGPSIFTALQEQLGLRLIPARAPGNFLTIESVEMPNEN